MKINFKGLQKLYNSTIDLMLDKEGLTSEVTLAYGVSDKEICPNCIFDSLTNKSANSYKTGGPLPFDNGVICPYCYGLGFVGKEKEFDNIYLIVLWDSKTWINFNTDIKNTDDYIQTICAESLRKQIESANYMIVKNKKFERQGSANYAGLGDSNYIITTWRQTA
jgi:hypothetical protein